MHILTTGNLGYIGPVTTRHLRETLPAARLSGMDCGYFADAATEVGPWPETALDTQHFCDVRKVVPEMFRGVDSVVHLAAISNDPMGKAFESVTHQVNCEASVNIARAAKKAGASRFVFASSCSVYGFAESAPRTESSELNPLTAYARSKVETEERLSELASNDFVITCLRFATACGMSPRLRLDLVLNDFVASAITTNKIEILSNGEPWRPLINVKDMARAIEWGVTRDVANGGEFLVVNAGSDEWNRQVKELAHAVQERMSGVAVSINPDAQPDKRTYKVDFSMFRSLAPAHQPIHGLEQTIDELKSGLEAMAFDDADFRNSGLIRLRRLAGLKKAGQIDGDLYWRR